MATKRAFQRQFTDAALRETKALPAAAGSTVTDPIDTGERSARASFESDVEVRLTTPALSDAIVDNAETITYLIEGDNDVAFGSPTTLYTVTLTGAGAGAAAAEYRIGLTSFAERYVRAKATTGTGAGDASGATMTLEIVK